MYKKYLEIAVKELDNLKGFERANLALKIAGFLADHDTPNVVPTKNDLESKPVEFINLNPKADITKKMKEQQQKENEKKNPKERTIVLSEHPLELKQVPVDEKEKPEAPAQEAPKAQETQETSEEITEEWKSRILQREDFDRTWTPRMLANRDLADTFKRLGGFVFGGIKKNIFKIEWVNEETSRATGGRITKIDVSSKEGFMNSIPPAATKFIYGHLVKAYKESRNKESAA